jgi:hypothetical protein
MNKKQRMNAAIERHGENLKAIFGLPTDTDPVTLCKKLRRIENSASAHALRACNFGISDAEHERIKKNVMRQLAKVLGPVNEATVWMNWDPRGYALKLTEEASKTANIHKDWGGYGILAPDYSEGDN